jgi:hypothetical protein
MSDGFTPSSTNSDRRRKLIFISAGLGLIGIALGIYIILKGPTGDIRYQVGPQPATEFDPDFPPFSPLIPSYIMVHVVWIILCGLALIWILQLSYFKLTSFRKVISKASPKVAPIVGTTSLAGFALLGGPAEVRQTVPPLNVSVGQETRAPENILSLKVTPDGPGKIYSNQQVPIGVIISLESAPLGQTSLLLDGTRGYFVTTTFQHGAFDVSSDYRKPREDILKAGAPVKWSWIIAPKLDRLGEQQIVFDTEVFDETKTRMLGRTSVTAAVDVHYPVPIPIWLVYIGPMLSFAALIPLGQLASTEISNRLKERREYRRQQEQRQLEQRHLDQRQLEQQYSVTNESTKVKTSEPEKHIDMTASEIQRPTGPPSKVKRNQKKKTKHR